ncbi:MAG: HD domain-containing phosphohydrolase, partial [Acidobacteriota bacterium]
ISNVPDLEGVAAIIRYQHEHYGGNGFFEGLDGEKIPFLSRILAVANAFDEVKSGRNPSLFCTEEKAVQWLKKYSGTRFDPQVVEACLAVESSKLAGLPPHDLSDEVSRNGTEARRVHLSPQDLSHVQ